MTAARPVSMSKARAKNFGWRPWLALALVIASRAAAQSDSYYSSWWNTSRQEETWPRHFRVGALLGLNLKADFRLTGSGPFTVTGGQPGPATSGIDHFYDDGYVRVDATGNAGDNGGYTSYWGYNNSGQDIGGSLLFHSAKTFVGSGSAQEAGGALPGVDVAYGGQLFNFHSAQVGWELGFGWLSVDIENKRPISIVATRTVHSYSTAGIIVPDAPYNGGFGPGSAPTIGAMPEALADDTETGGLTGTRLEASLYALRFGPTLHWELPRRFAVQAGGGVAAGFVTGELNLDETLRFEDGSSARNNGGSFSDSKFVYGGYVGGTLMYHAEKHGDFYLGVQYMPLGSATFSGGGREAKLNMSGGIYISAGINWPF